MNNTIQVSITGHRIISDLTLLTINISSTFFFINDRVIVLNIIVFPLSNRSDSKYCPIY